MSGNGNSLREAFFAVPEEPAYEDVPMPFGTVRVYALTAREKDDFDIAHAKADGANFRARLVVATARDRSGIRMFRDADLIAISARPLPQIEPLVEAAIRVNRMSDRERGELEKNSESRADASSSG